MKKEEGTWSVAVRGLTVQERREFKSHVGRLGTSVGIQIAELVRAFIRFENANLRALVMSDAWMEKEQAVDVDLVAPVQAPEGVFGESAVSLAQEYTAANPGPPAPKRDFGGTAAQS